MLLLKLQITGLCYELGEYREELTTEMKTHWITIMTKMTMITTITITTIVLMIIMIITAIIMVIDITELIGISNKD